MYNWRLRAESDETDASFAARLFNQHIIAVHDYLNRTGIGATLFYNGGIRNANNLTGVIYCHAELGDDSYSGADKGSPEHPYATLTAIGSDNITNKVIVCVGRFTNGANTNVIIADTYGAAYFDSFSATGGTVYGCYLVATSCNGVFVNCVIQATYGTAFGHLVTSIIGCTIINANLYYSISLVFTTCLNCKGGVGTNGQQYGSIYINSNVSVFRNQNNAAIALSKAYYYNSDVTVGEGTESRPITVINIGEAYQSANDCFVDPIHLNFAVKRDEVRAGTPFADWLGFTGDSVDFVKVTGNNIRADSGSWTIDQQTPGEGRLLGAIMDNRGQFNNIFTGFNNNVFHYNSNNISIGPHEKFGTPVVVSAGANETLTITDEGMYCASKDCEIDNVAVGKYQNIWLEAGTYEVGSSNGVKFFPYNYESINNFVGCRFTNLGKCAVYAAGRTLKPNCSYLNQGSTDITVSDGTIVAAGKTYVTPDQSAYTADGNLLLVFDDAVDNFVWFSTNSFQTRYKAGYVVVNDKTEQNLLTRDGKTIPCTEAFGEYNGIRCLASQNMQHDFFQVVVDYKVYQFD